MANILQTLAYGALSLLGLGFLIWIFVRALQRSAEPWVLIVKWLITVPVVYYGFRAAGAAIAAGGYAAVNGAIITLVVCIIIYVLWRHSIIDLLSQPLTGIFDGGNEPPEPKPAYSIALAKRKTNRPLEAIVAVREQLAKFPKDFEGVMLLANIQAEDMNDLPGAELTLNRFCHLPGVPERQVVAAWTQLADWHLKKAADADSARAALQQIAERFPGSEAALRAEQRIAHLGESEKVVLTHHDPRNVDVPEGVKNIGLLDSSAFLQPQEIEPGQLAAAYLKHLEAHPHDAETREKLATLYAQDFRRLDLATMELAQLINEPRYSPRQVAGWLNRLASFQVELGAEESVARETLEKIIENFPGSAAAEQAANRLARLRNEFTVKKETPSARLGVYEQNIGLKYGSPRKL